MGTVAGHNQPLQKFKGGGLFAIAALDLRREDTL